MWGRISHSSNGGAERDSVMKSASFGRVCGIGLMRETLSCPFYGMWNRPMGKVSRDFVMRSVV
jgi:hypothetical protein